MKHHTSTTVTKTQPNTTFTLTNYSTLCVSGMAAPDGLALSPCAPITPSSEGSDVTPGSAQNVMTPSTPELYSVLQLNYYRRYILCVSLPLSLSPSVSHTLCLSLYVCIYI